MWRLLPVYRKKKKVKKKRRTEEEEEEEGRAGVAVGQKGNAEEEEKRERKRSRGRRRGVLREERAEGETGRESLGGFPSSPACSELPVGERSAPA